MSLTFKTPVGLDRHRVLPALRLLTLGIATLALALGCDRLASARDRFPRIVLVTLDTLNVQFTDPYRPQADLTPHLEDFASQGTLFELAHTSVPLTLPSHAAIFTGQSPVRTGVMLNGDRVPADLPIWAELLRQRGWATGAFVSLGVLKSRYGLARGFDTYDDRIDEVVRRWYLTADEVVERVRPWVRDHRERPFFIWVHFSDPHEPYVGKDAPPDTRLFLDGEPLGSWPLATKTSYFLTFELPAGRHRLRWESLRSRRPDDRRRTGMGVRIRNPEVLRPWAVEPPTPLDEEIRIKYPWEVDLLNPGPSPVTIELQFHGRLRNPSRSQAEELYARRVAFTDRYFGELRELFREQALHRDTLWIVVSDHGEGLRRTFGHALFNFQAQLRVMWMMSGPGIPSGRRLDQSPVLLEDVLPTVLDHLGLPAPEGLDGVSQRGCWTGTGCRGREEWWAYGLNAKHERLTAVAGYRWPIKVSWHRKGWGRRLHDLAADPWEWDDLLQDGAAAPGPGGTVLLRRLDRQRGILQRRLDERRREGPLDAEDREMLEALGYL